MVWVKRVGSLKVSVVLLSVLFAIILVGTLGQAAWGSAAIQTTLFSQVFFQAAGLWFPGLPFFLALTGVNLAAGAWFHLERSVRHLGLWGLHGSLVLFCFGSLGFSLAQEDLVLGIAPGASTAQAFVREEVSTLETRPLPFSLTLVSFKEETYPGTDEPSDFISLVTLRTGQSERSGEVRMNQPLREAGWTIYQSSVQTVGGVPAPVFKLVHNPWGPFPYLISTLLVLSLGAHLGWGRRKGVGNV